MVQVSPSNNCLVLLHCLLKNCLLCVCTVFECVCKCISAVALLVKGSSHSCSVGADPTSFIWLSGALTRTILTLTHTHNQICCGEVWHGSGGCELGEVLAFTFHFFTGTCWRSYIWAISQSFWSGRAGVAFLSLAALASRRSACPFVVWTWWSRVSPSSISPWTTTLSYFPWITLWASRALRSHGANGSLVSLFSLFPLVSHHIRTDGELGLTHSWEPHICFKGTPVAEEGLLDTA